ncbi:chorismate mutase [Leucobacter sp. NPDC058333]|uniref:chorismate mutase n=1 Tax=Leucobacter sp. NPDC058333 TaxID=3346450 RepID=UPI00365DA8F8
MPDPAALSVVRDNIDAIDRRLVELIAKREQWVIRAGSLKSDDAAVRAPARVEQVIEKVRTLATVAGASPEVVEHTYRAMIEAFIELELNTSAESRADSASVPERG